MERLGRLVGSCKGPEAGALCIQRRPEGWRSGVNEKVRRGDERGKRPVYRLGSDSEREGAWGILRPGELRVYLLFERPRWPLREQQMEGAGQKWGDQVGGSCSI